MHLGIVFGTVTATRKSEDLDGLKILLVQPLNHQCQPAGEPIAAIDTVQTGAGEIVYYVLGREASLALDRPFVPIDAAIIGVVDDINVEHVSADNKKALIRKKHT